MRRASALATFIIAAGASTLCLAEPYPVQPLAVERDNLDEAYQRAQWAQPNGKKALAARRAAFLAFAASVCKGPDIDHDACLGRIYNNQAMEFDAPVRIVGPYRIRPVQTFGRAGNKAYTLNLGELSRTDGKPDAQLAAFNQAIRARALKLVAERGEAGKLSDVDLLIASAGGGLISARLVFGLTGYTAGQENTASRTYCLTEFPWLLAERRPLAMTDLFDDPQKALAALRSSTQAQASAAELADPERWGFTRARLQFARPSPNCFDEDQPELEAATSVIAPYLRKSGPVDLTALVDVKYDD